MDWGASPHKTYERANILTYILRARGSKLNNNTLLFGLVCLLPSFLGQPPIPPMGETGLILMFAAKMIAVVLMWDLELTLRDGLILLGLYPLVIALQLVLA